MLALTGPRIRASGAARSRSLGLDESTLAHSGSVIHQALRGGKSLTRPEIGRLLRDSGLDTIDGPKLAHTLLSAELDALICSGPRRARQQTYALLDERAPTAPVLDRDAAVAELTWRYFSSHGPALVRDCAWWSGLAMGEIRRGLDANAHRLQCETLDSNTYWFAPPADRCAPPANGSAYLLPNYDEYTVAYRERDLYYDRAANSIGDRWLDVPFRHVLLVDGQVVGRWSPTAPQLQLQWAMTPTPAQRRAVEAAATRYSEFVCQSAESSASAS